jgi:hypothetical protein
VGHEQQAGVASLDEKHAASVVLSSLTINCIPCMYHIMQCNVIVNCSFLQQQWQSLKFFYEKMNKQL